MVKRGPVSLALACLALMASATMAADPTYVVHISVDGLGYNYLQNLMLPTQTTYNVDNFKRLVNEGAYTFNARNEYFYTETLQNHTTQLTARPANTTTAGHGVTANPGSFLDTETIENKYKGSYVASVFDVVHDNGMTTQLLGGKDKFKLFTNSWNGTYGALDTSGVDYGRNKIDYGVFNAGDAADVVTSYVNRATAVTTQYSFLHFMDPDYAGHYEGGWGNAGYNASLQACDAALGTVLNFITSNTTYKDNTYIILTADHGGTGTGHGTASDPKNYQIPFFVWGPDVPAHTDLYDLNLGLRFDPEGARYDYTYADQPIRNGEAVNLALDLLGLSAIPGSFYNSAQNLIVTVPEPASLAVLSLGGVLLLARRKHRHA